MIINVKPDKNHRPTYIIEGAEHKPSFLKQVWNGIVTAFKIFLIIVIVFVALYLTGKQPII